MNKKFQEIAEKAGVLKVRATSDGVVEYIRPEVEKFAELIILECAKACEDPACNTLESPLELINQHFGIE
jgi:hypothetical protein